MALPNQGNSISLSQINTELGRAANAQVSLNTAEDGTYSPINQCSIFRPSATNPASLSEWFAYNHTIPCIYYNCTGYSNVSYQEACSGTIACVPTIASHDYVIVRLRWPTTSGSDLDIIASFTNTGVGGVQGNTIGYGQGSYTVPDNTTLVQDAFVYWNGDNTSSGVEAFSVNYGRLLNVYPGITDNPIRFRLNAWWFGNRLTGEITVEFYAFSGGYPTVGSQFNMLPGGGSVLTDYVKLNVVVTANRSEAGGVPITFANSQTLGYLNYDPVSKTATFTQS
jgi:hypothetical protein